MMLRLLRAFFPDRRRRDFLRLADSLRVAASKRAMTYRPRAPYDCHRARAEADTLLEVERIVREMADQ